MNIVVWGVGKHALNKILPAIEENKKLDLYGVYSRSVSTINKCIEAYSCRSWESSSEMLNDDNILTCIQGYSFLARILRRYSVITSNVNSYHL